MRELSEIETFESWLKDACGHEIKASANSDIHTISDTESYILHECSTCGAYISNGITQYWSFYGEPSLDEMTAIKDIIERVIRKANPQEEPPFPSIPIKPLPDGMPQVLEFTYDMLPPVISNFIFDVSDRQQSPVDFIAVAAIASLASIIGNKVNIKPKRNDNWRITPNLWAGIVGAPSTSKSPSISAACKPLMKIEKDATAEYEQAMLDYKADVMIHEMTGKNKKKEAEKMIKTGLRSNIEEARELLSEMEGDAPIPPCRDRRVVNDATVEKLGELLNQNPNGLCLVRDELAGWLAQMAQEDRQSDRAFYLECYNGNSSFTYDRIGRGTVEIARCTLSVIGGVQPSKLKPVIQKAVQGTGDDGLIQRMQLCVFPNDLTKYNYKDVAPNQVAESAYHDLFDSLNTHIKNIKDEKTYRFSEEAQSFFVEWFTDLQERSRDSELNSAVSSHMLKTPKTICSLALIFELIEPSADMDGEVGVPSLMMAVKWAAYLQTHSNRVYSLGLTAEVDGAKLILSRINKLGNIFTAREIKRKGWTGLNNDMVDLSLNLLVDHGYLLSGSKMTGGRPQTTYKINPDFRGL